VQATVWFRSPTAIVRKAFKVTGRGRKYYEVRVTIRGHEEKLQIDRHGKLLQIQQTVPLRSLPAIVGSAIADSAAGSEVLEVRSTIRGDTVAAYEARIRQGSKKWKLRLDPLGRPLVAPGAVESSGTMEPRR
jgi:hypothetical protein